MLEEAAKRDHLWVAKSPLSIMHPLGRQQMRIQMDVAILAELNGMRAPINNRTSISNIGSENSKLAQR